MSAYTDTKILSHAKGFTLLEVMIVVAIVGILVAIAYPSYQAYVVRTKRADMMSELQNIANQIERRKLAAGRGGYVTLANNKNQEIQDLLGNYPRSGSGGTLYTITINDLATGNWQLVATPSANSTQGRDGALSLNHVGVKCRGTSCGMSDEWRQ